MYEKTPESGWVFSGDFARKVWRVMEEKEEETMLQFKKKGGFFSPGKTYLCSIAKKMRKYMFNKR